ncbi:NeuD/PglB/VioB family sugar acetyltransferase [Syntrophobotulus glycolicus]|nr:NeuD/PglB/VioB family sugar acetyltransferase [Syntrophobotulus glycolicus]
MKDLIIYGSGGLAKEIVQLIKDINSVHEEWRILGYIDDTRPGYEKLICGYRILGSSEILKDFTSKTNIVIAIGDPRTKKSIYEKIKEYQLSFPTLVHPKAKVADGAALGEGAILGLDTVVSVDVNIGKFVLLNMRAVIGHDVKIGDFSSCLVNCVVAGNVIIEQSVLIGSNAVIMEKINIGEEVKIGMGTVIYFDVPDKHVVMNKPLKPIYLG